MVVHSIMIATEKGGEKLLRRVGLHLVLQQLGQVLARRSTLVDPLLCVFRQPRPLSIGVRTEEWHG